MKTGKRLDKLVLAILFGLAIVAGIFNTSQASGFSASQIDPLEKTHILNATVQIYIYLLVPPSGIPTFAHGTLPVYQVKADLQQGWGYLEAHALGTVVMDHGAEAIVTHDHWENMFVDADLVRFYDSQGTLLEELNGPEVESLVRYQDAGTLILNAPKGLEITPANLGDPHQTKNGDRVLVTRQDVNAEGKVEVVEAKIDRQRHFKGLDSWRLAVGDGILGPGDSGGGVWLNGRLVGNNWATDTCLNWRVWTWISWRPEKVLTWYSYAAFLP